MNISRFAITTINFNNYKYIYIYILQYVFMRNIIKNIFNNKKYKYPNY